MKDRLRILIIDNDEQSLNTSREVLEGFGYIVDTAVNGQEALETARRNPPHIAASETLMPDMDGLTLCREWKQDEGLKKIPFVYYTTKFKDSKAKNIALDMGAERFLDKPLPPEDFNAILREVIDKAQADQEEADKDDYFKIHNEKTMRRMIEKVLHLEEKIAEHEQAEAEINQRSQQLIALNQIGQTLSSNLNLEGVLSQVAEVTPTLINAEGLGVLLLENETELVFAAGSGKAAEALLGKRMPTSAGAAGQVLKTGQALLVNQETDPVKLYRELEKVSGYHAQSLVAAPIKLGGEIIGVVEAVHSIPNYFREADLQTMETVSIWTGIAIGNARQHEALERRLDESQALAAINQALNKTLDLDHVLQLIVDSANRIIPKVERAIIHLYEDEEQALVPAAVAGAIDRGIPSSYMRPGEGIAGQVMVQGTTINVRDTHTDNRFVQSGEDTGLRSLLVAPVQSGVRRLGTISVSSATANAFSLDDERLLTTLGLQAALAIESARLFKETQGQVEELTILHSLAVTSGSATSEEEIIVLGTDVIGDMLTPDHFGVLFVDEIAGVLRPHPSYHQNDLTIEMLTLPLDQGLIGEVLSDGQPHRVLDLEDEAYEREYSPRTRTQICVPIKLGERVIGVINAESYQPRTFSEDHTRLLTTLAGQLASALGNIRLLAETKERATHLELLNDINRIVLQAPVLVAVLSTLADWLSKLMEVDHCYISLWDDTRQLAIPIAASSPLNELFRNIEVNPGEPTITESALNAGHSLLIDDAHETPMISRHLTSRIPIQSMLSVPMIVGEQKLGAIQFTYDQEHAFTQEEISRAENAVGQIALAIANTRLLESEQRRRQEAETLREVAAALSSTLEIKQVLDRTLMHLVRVIPCDSASIYLIIDGDRSSLQATRGFPDPEVLGHEFPGDEPLFMAMRTTKQPIILDDVRKDSRWFDWEAVDYVLGWMGVPLIVHQEVIGFLTIDSCQTRAYGELEANMAQAFANQASTAIANATLYTELEESLEKEKSAQAQLVQSEKLAAMGRLVASVAHELNNPLQAIQNALYLVKMEEALSEQAGDDLQVALDETSRMANLIARLREAYRPTSTEDYQPGSLNTLVEEVQKLIGTHVRHSDVHVDFTPDPDLPSVPMIRDQIKQVILNLCLNAVEIMPEGGKLDIQSRYHPKRGCVALSIKDTGHGIDPAVLPNIFEPFFTTKEGGTGLGLAVSYEIVQNHSGHIDVDSKPDEGSTFTIWLPEMR